MSGPRLLGSGVRLLNLLPGTLLLLSTLLTVVWMAPGMPDPAQDSAWVLALNQAMADRLAFGREVMYPLGPWGDVYAGQYHPAADRMMLAGGTIVAVALAAGLSAVAQGRRRWLPLLVPLLVATVAERDPVFIVVPLLLVVVAAAPPRFAQHAALLSLTAACALLTLVKGTFGTEAVPMVGLAALAVALGRRSGLAALMLATYAVALAALWRIAGQDLADLPRYAVSMLAVIGGYSEGLALDGPWSDVAAYLVGSAALVWLGWRDRVPGHRPGAVLLPALMFTLFVAFKSGFVRHDEHALIAAGTLAMVPVVLLAVLRPRHLMASVAITLAVLAFISHHHPGYEWPSARRGWDRVATAAAGSWHRLADPGRLGRQFDATMAAVRTASPLPPIKGPSDIYSSGQMLLLANGLEWSPRPALQSVTVLSDTMARADLGHLLATDGRTPVQNVFYRVEDEDNRLRTTMDGPSWPILLTQFRVDGYDRALDLALLRRQPGARAAPSPGSPLLDGAYRLGEGVAIPVLPDGLAWATLDIQPTLAGHLASLLFRPPLLTIAIRYANGPVEHYRLVSGLARLGFLLTPRTSSTQDMLGLLLPERSEPGRRPVSIVVSGESGTRWLWQPRFTLRLQAMDIPVQEQVRAMLAPASLDPVAAPVREAGMTDACAIELVNGRPPPAGLVEAQRTLDVSGWSVISVPQGQAPERVVVRLTDAAGHAWQAIAEPRPRLDVAGYFVNPALTVSGFDARFDISSLVGTYKVTILAERDNSSWRCKPTVDVRIVAPARETPG